MAIPEAAFSGLRKVAEGLHEALGNFKKSRVIKWLKVIITIGAAMAGIYLFLLSLQFPIFFFEESDQKMSFAAFNAVDSGSWGLVIRIVDAMEENRQQANKWIRRVGWIHPVAKEAYNSYFNLTTPLYMESLLARAYQGGEVDIPPPMIDQAILDGGPIPEYGTTAGPLQLVGNALPPPDIPGAELYTNAHRWYGSDQEVTIIVPIVHFERKTTSNGSAMGLLASDSNFKLISYTSSVINRMPTLRGQWVAVHGEIIKYNQYYEIVVGSWSQIIETTPYIEGLESPS